MKGPKGAGNVFLIFFFFLGEKIYLYEKGEGSLTWINVV
jgi:hypothetical protein